ncbi:MAG: Uma2 family endonuclease [Saprospiraceae bacterium]
MNILKETITYREFKKMEFDDNDTSWYEIINGELVRKQAPTTDHQAISAEIVFHLTSFSKKTKSGRVLFAPLDVVFEDENMFHPDILFIRKERLFIVDEKEKVVMGAPDLVVEILSKSTASDDKGEKKDVYEKFGVKEYWLVDPVKKAFEVYTLVNDRFKLTTYLEGEGTLKSGLLEGFEMDIEQVFEEAKF